MSGIDDTRVDGLLDDARELLARERAAIAPDFAAVLARAQRGVSAELDDASLDAHENVVDIRTRGRAGGADALVDGLVGDAREVIEQAVARRRMRPIPEPFAAVRPRRRIGTIAVGVGLVAAALVVVFAGVRVVERLRASEPEPLREQAFRSQVEGAREGVALPREPEPPPSVRDREASPPAPAELEPEVVVPPAIAAPERAAPKSTPDRDQLRVLADEAHALWRAGDRTGAARKFERIVALGKRTSQAELAYGDLFALARQQGDPAVEQKRWKAYLGRFPRGRYADDARAGLCRRDRDPQSCWAAYLRDFPRGSYRAEARGIVGEEPPR